jgi:hypothetical protein
MNMPLFFLLALVTGPPIQRVGETCPLGYWRNGGYCVVSPGAVEVRDTLPNPALDTCPLGWYRAKGYCLRTR